MPSARLAIAPLLGACAVALVLPVGCAGEILGERAPPRPEDEPPTPTEDVCATTAAHPGSRPIARLTRWEYVATIRHLFGVDVSGAAEALPYEIRAPLSTTAVAQSVDFKHVETFSSVSEVVADAVPDLAGAFGDCARFDPPCEEAFVRALGAHVFRRPLRDEEVGPFRTIFGVVRDEGDAFDVAAKLVLRAMLQSPQFLYHLEDRRGDGVRAVDAFAMAGRLSYLVWHSAPDDALLAAAADGALTTHGDIEAQVRRLARDPRARAASLVFFEDWVDLTRLERAVRGIGDGLKAQMRAETERFVEEVLWNDEGGLVDLLRGETTWVTPELAALYGIESAGAGVRAYDLGGVPERRGVLTQASVLAAHANGNRPTIVSRGLFLLRSLLCRDVPDPPANVDTSSTDLPEDASERDSSAERLGRASCQGCHRTFDPLAYAFDEFDGTGRRRTAGADGTPIRTDGWIPAGYGSFPAEDPRAVDHPYGDVNAIALPFLDEMLVDSVFAADPAPPARVLTMFFGLGIPRPFQGDDYVRPYRGHLAPLAQVADGICFPRGVHYQKGSRTSGNHARGSQTAFVGDRGTGASIDQRVLSTLHGGTSPTAIRSLVAGTYTRQDGNQRHVHSWIAPNTPTAQPVESPRELFDQVFGSFMPPDDTSGADPAAIRRARYERSVLDSAIEQYRYAKSDAFGLGATSKAKLELHLERIREIERRIFDPDSVVEPPATTAGCPPARPPVYDHPEMGEIQKKVNNEGVRMRVDRWMELWHSMADVYAMAVKCDVSRFGNLQFQSGGERIELYGEYEAYGQRRSFDDSETTHEYWHRWSPGSADERRMLDHIWLMMAEVTYFLKALDDPDYRDANGGTVLDNALVLVGTELGDGRPHDIEDVFHLIAGGNGAVRNGEVVDVDVQATELYSAGLRAIGVDDVSMEGDRDYEGSVADAVLT